MTSTPNPATAATPAECAEQTMLSRARSRTLRREFLIFLGFVVLTAVMTWPWVLHLRDAVADEGDSYAHAYFLWWDYHQTIHDPLNLFHATIFYPYRYTLAFGENDYGISLLFFPLFALGFTPLAVHCIATLSGYAISGYGAFRLGRTLTGSIAAACVTGVVFAFCPYHIFKFPHLHYLFTCWIPLTLEALVLFSRERTWRRASWLGMAFFMNALTCISWLLLTLIPFAFATVILILRYGLARDRNFWKRGATAIVIALLLLLPFLLPYYRVSKTYGFKRTSEDAEAYSAKLENWMVVDEASERRHLASRSMIGQRPDIREQDVWRNIGENLSRQPQKASALDMLHRIAETPPQVQRRIVRHGAARA